MVPTTRGGVCGICSTKLDKYEDRIKCVRCFESVHIKCVNVTIQDYQELNESDALKTWKCPGCVNKISDSDAAAADGGSDHAVAGNDVDLLTSILAKINLLVDKSDTSCNCSKLIQGLTDENKRLSNLIKSQTKLLNEMRAEFQDKIGGLENKISVVEVIKPPLVNKNTELSPITVDKVSLAKTSQDVVGPRFNESNRTQQEMSHPAATYVDNSGRGTPKEAERLPGQPGTHEGNELAVQAGVANIGRGDDNSNNKDGVFRPVIGRRHRRT